MIPSTDSENGSEVQSGFADARQVQEHRPPRARLDEERLGESVARALGRRPLGDAVLRVDVFAAVVDEPAPVDQPRRHQVAREPGFGQAHRVELHELHVLEQCARAQCERVALPHDPAGVVVPGEETARPAAGEHDGSGAQPQPLPRPRPEGRQRPTPSSQRSSLATTPDRNSVPAARLRSTRQRTISSPQTGARPRL